MDDLGITYLIKNTVFRPFYVLHTAQNVNKIFPGFHDNVKAIKSRDKSWPGLKSACYISKVQFGSTVTNNVAIKRHLQRSTMLFN